MKTASAPLELQAIVPDYMIPFAPILQADEEPFAMLGDLPNKHDWVLDVIEYPSADRLIEVLEDEIDRPAEKNLSFLLRSHRLAQYDNAARETRDSCAERVLDLNKRLFHLIDSEPTAEQLLS